MRAERVDHRDQTFEVDAPAYRVFFWTPLGSPGAWRLDAWEVSDADTVEVFGWVREQAAGRLVSVWAVTRAAGQVEHIRLQGIDPTTHPDDDIWPSWAQSWRPEP